MSWANCDRGGENCDGKLIRVTSPVLWRARLENLWSPAKGFIEQLIRGELDTGSATKLQRLLNPCSGLKTFIRQ